MDIQPCCVLRLQCLPSHTGRYYRSNSGTRTVHSGHDWMGNVQKDLGTRHGLRYIIR